MATMLLTPLLLPLLLPTPARAQSDGNPHNWDRRRRCDHVDYNPPCGACEGYGGIPYGDKNEQIHLTTCNEVPMTDAEKESLVRPVWGRTWTTKSWEILIGPKNDPFCFKAFPSNSSVGSLCYNPQTGTQYYDFNNSRSLREDIVVKTKVGNVSTMLIHRDTNLWIVNKLPWYALGIHQCICTTVHQGGDKTQPGVYPVATNWTNNLHFVARENITVEYDQGTHVLDHWAFGPHHVWVFPESGQILRMWQPFNGLQVFPMGANPGPVDPSLFNDIPPTLCKKGGAKFRIGCDDDGFPMPKEEEKVIQRNEQQAAAAAAEAADAHGKAYANDKRRAYQKVPSHSFRGSSFEEMSNTLNHWLMANPLIQTVPCSLWNATQLQKVQTILWEARHEGFDSIYQETDDKRRLLHPGLGAMQEQWAGENAARDRSGDFELAHEVQRDGHCHEAVMWYTHHLTQETKELLSEAFGVAGGLVLPLLSTERHSCEGPRYEAADPSLCRAYEDRVTCASCHSDSPM